MSFSIIAAIGEKGELGKDGNLVFSLPGDLAFFKEITDKHPVVMGRKTFASLPKILPGRDHYVITRMAETEFFEKFQEKLVTLDSEKIILVSDLADFIEKHQDSGEEFFIIGGRKIYQQFLPLAHKLYLTEIAATAPADTFFPDFDHDLYKRKIIKQGSDNDITYTHVLYTKK